MRPMNRLIPLPDREVIPERRERGDWFEYRGQIQSPRLVDKVDSGIGHFLIVYRVNISARMVLRNKKINVNVLLRPNKHFK